jgi:hypothetical protein
MFLVFSNEESLIEEPKVKEGYAGITFLLSLIERVF